MFTLTEFVYFNYGLNDEVWEVRFHFHDRHNLERSLNVDDITFYNLIALIELEGYGMTDFMYYVRDPGVGVSGIEELTDEINHPELKEILIKLGQSVFTDNNLKEK